jgi:hypothetical protein
MSIEQNQRMPKIKESGTFKASAQAISYAKDALADMHTTEQWTLAERLDVVMREQVKKFVAEIRRDE